MYRPKPISGATSSPTVPRACATRHTGEGLGLGGAESDRESWSTISFIFTAKATSSQARSFDDPFVRRAYAREWRRHPGGRNFFWYLNAID